MIYRPKSLLILIFLQYQFHKAIYTKKIIVTFNNSDSAKECISKRKSLSTKFFKKSIIRPSLNNTELKRHNNLYHATKIILLIVLNHSNTFNYVSNN